MEEIILKFKEEKMLKDRLKPVGFRIETCQKCGKQFGTGAPSYQIPEHKCKPTKEWEEKQKKFFAIFEKRKK